MTAYKQTMAEAMQSMYLSEDNIDLMRKAAGGAAQTVKMKDGNLKMDMFTASAIMQVYDKVNPANQKKMAVMINKGTKAGMLKLQDFAMKQVKSGYGEELDLDEAKLLARGGGKKVVDDNGVIKLINNQGKLIADGELINGKYEMDFVDTSRRPSGMVADTPRDILKMQEEVDLDEGKEKGPKQLTNPNKEVMVVKKNKVVVIDKKDQDKYLKQGWTLAEEDESETKYKVTNDKLGVWTGVASSEDNAVEKAMRKWGVVGNVEYTADTTVEIIEDVELDELSKKTLDKYFDKAARNAGKRYRRLDKDFPKVGKDRTKEVSRLSRRNKGLDRASDRMSGKMTVKYGSKSEGKGYQVYVKSATAKSGWISQGQPWKTEKEAKKDAKNFAPEVTKVVKEEVELNEAKPEFEVKYAKSKGAPIKVTKFMTLDQAKKFLDDVKKDGMNGIISKGGKPVKEQLAKIKGNSPADKGRKAAVEDDIERAEKNGDKKEVEKLKENELVEGKMSQLHQHIKDKKSAEEIAKIMKLDVKTIKALMSSYESTDGDTMGENGKYMEMLAAACGGAEPIALGYNPMDEGAAADARRAMSKDPDFSRKDGADDDDSATDDDIKGASKNIIMQLRKAISLKGRFDVEFGDKKKFKVPAKMAMAVTQKYNSLKRPADKEKFQAQIAKSYKDMLKILKAGYHGEQKESILDRIDRKIKENKNG